MNTRPSLAAERNPDVKVQRRPRGKSNSEWLRAATGRTDPVGSLVLIGGCGLSDFRLRVAQSQARMDLLPSFWSHATIIRGFERNGDWDMYEVSLEPARGFGAVPLNNGVQEGRFSTYDDPERYPNIAWLRFKVSSKALQKEIPSPTVGAKPVVRQRTMSEALEGNVREFRKRRGMLDLSVMITEWLAFCWGTAEKGNPLVKNIGVPSAVFAESIFAMLGVELTPGLATQSSCPEAIWQAVTWWHDFYKSEASLTESAPSGRYFVGQSAAAVVELESRRPAPPSPRAGRKRRRA